MSRVIFRLLGLGPHLCLLLLWLLPQTVSATHIVGGELDLRHKTGNVYTLTLNLYFDALNGQTGAIRPSLSAGIYAKGTNRYIATVSMPKVSDTYVQYTSPACASGSLSTRKMVYASNVIIDASLFNSPDGYYVAVENCCRNAGIKNIRAPGNAGQTYYLEFPAVVRNGRPFIDSTPQIFPPLSDYACLNELFYYDFGGQDPDGDSLAYDMVTPLNGHATPGNPDPGLALSAPYSLVSWNTGLDEQNQMPGAPTLRVNARTGRLTVRPTDEGLFVFGVRCSEYRNGVKIGETRRDFQLLVVRCPTNQPPRLQVTMPGTAQPYRFGRDTLRLVPNGNRCLRIRYTDPDPGSVLTMSTRAVNFTGQLPTFTTRTSGTVRMAGQPDTLTATLCFPDCADTKGKVFLLDLIVADDGCSLPKHDTLRVAFTATQPPNAAPELSSTLPPAPLPAADANPAVVRIVIGQTYSATLLGLDPDNNALTLTAVGEGFDLPGAGMRFSARNGAGRASADFAWEPDCGTVAAIGTGNGLLVRFRLQEAGPCVPLSRERVVRFVVDPVPDPKPFKPSNVITPNADGSNDSFYMPDLPLDFCDRKFARIVIYSRWGQPVFKSEERGFEWGGQGMGGLYYYLVTYTDGRRFKGWVEVIP